MPQKGRYPDNMTIGQVIDMIKDIRDSDEKLDEELISDFGLTGDARQTNADAIRWNHTESQRIAGFSLQS